jgi:xylan 1,4-beta-xylosidase
MTMPGVWTLARPTTALLLAVAAVAAPGHAEEARIHSFDNPVVPGFHPDPSVVRVGSWFYLVNSSFEMFPGVPVRRSGDLVHWELIGHALTRDSQLPLAGAGPSRGIFAPTIRYHDGTFYVITTNLTAGGNFLVTAEDPSGPWSEPIWIPGQGGIDPSLFFDDDGTVYLQTTGGPSGLASARGIWQSTLDVNTGELIEGPRLLWPGTGGRYPEGPHLYRVGDHYFLMISEGGTEYGHMVTIARADSPWGPFESCPRNPILTHRDTELDQPIQGTGHADLVQAADGSWWMVFLAFRPVGGSYFHHLGRETFLAPLTWDDAGWPLVNGGKPISLAMEVDGLPSHPLPEPPVRDPFDGPLGFEWNHLRNPYRASYSTTERPGWLALHGTALTLAEAASPTFVGRRQEHLRVRMATRLDFVPQRAADEAGLALYRDPSHRYELGVRRGAGGREVFVRQTVGPYLSAVTASAAAPGEAPLILEVRAEPLEYTFWWGSSAGELTRLGAAATRYLATEVAGGFIGTYVGLYATGNGSPAAAPAAADWFDYAPGSDARH